MSLQILVAEDNEYTALQYSRMLEKNGHNVTITRDGEQCIEKYEECCKNSEIGSTNKNPFDVVVLDNNMPKMTGVEVAEQILDKKPDQRIIFASAYDIGSLQNTSDKIKKSVEIIAKPFSLMSMIDTIENKIK